MKAKSYRPTDPQWAHGPERLQKLLARAGFGSRRACEELIENSRVTVDGDIITELGAKADPAEHDIRVDGERISFPQRVVYLLYKPRGYLCTNSDELGRNDQLAVDLIPASESMRLYTVGRLDKDSEGLILVTNDGELTNRMTHPSFRVPKIYRVTVRGVINPETRQKLMGGVWLAEGKTRVDNVRIKTSSRESSVIEMELSEGKNREIRRIFARVNHPVSRLQRVAIGPLTDFGMKAGSFRRLEDAEIDALFDTSSKIRKQRKQQAKERAKTKSRNARNPEAANAVSVNDKTKAGTSRGKQAGTPTGKRGNSTGERGAKVSRGPSGKPSGKPIGKPGKKFSGKPDRDPRTGNKIEPKRPKPAGKRGGKPKPSDSEFIG